MTYLNKDQYSLVIPLFRQVGSFHLCVHSVIDGTAPGQVWVDREDQPRVGLVESPEGIYLAGDPAATDCFDALRAVIPYMAYLIVDPPGWADRLPLVWSNPMVRPHHREHYLFQVGQPRLTPKVDVSAGYELKMVDRAFFDQCADLVHFEEVQEWVENGWRDFDLFFERGAGSCLVQGQVIAAWSLVDCFSGESCEIGVMTDSMHRRKGLGRAVAGATLETCLGRGYRQVGWQCLGGNLGSKAIALKLGFTKERDYLAYSSGLPAESPGGMRLEEWIDWAGHYEKYREAMVWPAIMAVYAWVQAHRLDEAMENLQFLRQKGWKGRPEWIWEDWRLEPVRDLPEFKRLLEDLV